MTVTIDTHSGFCFGVTAAIRKAEEELQRGPLFCLGDIVHNGQEVERLARLGLKTIDYDDLRTLHNVRVLLRAHGEPPSTYHIAEQNHIDIIDASCPVVLNLQKRIRETYRRIRETMPDSGAQIVIFGKVGHAEVIGLQGQTNDTAIVIESPDALLPPSPISTHPSATLPPHPSTTPDAQSSTTPCVHPSTTPGVQSSTTLGAQSSTPLIAHPSTTPSTQSLTLKNTKNSEALPNQLPIIDFQKPIFLFSQTTKSVEDFHRLVELIQSRIGEGVLFEWHDTICRNVANRVSSLCQFAQSNDMVVFVGGHKSSNAKVLFQHCLSANPRTVFVSSEEELTEAVLQACSAVDCLGICGATSTPMWLMERCRLRIEQYAAARPTES